MKYIEATLDNGYAGCEVSYYYAFPDTMSWDEIENAVGEDIDIFGYAEDYKPDYLDEDEEEDYYDGVSVECHEITKEQFLEWSV